MVLFPSGGNGWQEHGPIPIHWAVEKRQSIWGEAAATEENLTAQHW
jgi:hypothetical protein